MVLRNFVFLVWGCNRPYFHSFLNIGVRVISTVIIIGGGGDAKRAIDNAVAKQMSSDDANHTQRVLELFTRILNDIAAKYE